MAHPQIHTAYHVWFKWMDPLVLVGTVYALIFTPETMLDALIPAQLSAYNPDHGFLFHQLAAVYAFVGLMSGGLLRVTSDIKVWRMVQAGVLLIDIAMLASLYASINQQNRLTLEGMRGGDWGNLFLTVLVTCIRAAFLADVGVSYGDRAKKVD